MAEEIHVGDIGTVFEAEIQEDAAAVDISSATALSLLFLKPDGTVDTQTAVFSTDGTDGLIRYVTQEDDLDIPGRWRIQGRVTLSTGTWSSVISSFRVRPNLDA